uniref:MEIS N-terminal domain-containing protein n=1 Tax=Panagrolaimus sp. JU765 TaxID=591449 RepID=A0AC34Q9B0_9BILA
MNETEIQDYKNAIKNHFLFPVVKLLTEKCDAATQTLDSVFMDIEDVYEMLDTLIKTNQPKESDKEIDELIFNTIFMLRVHLLELSKLRSLVERFKTTYCDQIKKSLTKNSEYSSLGDSDDEIFTQSVPSQAPSITNPLHYLFSYLTVDQLTQFISGTDIKIAE